MTIPTVTNETIAGVADLKAGYTLGNADVMILKALAAELLAVREAQSVPVASTTKNNIDSVLSGVSTVIWPVRCFKGKAHVDLYTAPPAPAVTDMVGLSVSVDVSTSDDNAGYRYFGRITEVQQSLNPRDKGGVVLLVQDDVESNFDDGIAPDGYQMVPIEPTEAMINAGREIDSSPLNMSPRHRVEFIYRAMLAAAPTPTHE